MLVRARVEKERPTPSHTSSTVSSAPSKISGALSVLASYDGPFDDVFFTVNVFHGANVKVWWDEAAGTGGSISSRDGGFSTKVRLGVGTVLSQRTLICYLFDRLTVCSQPKMQAGITRIRHICSIRNGTFVSMTIAPGRAEGVLMERFHL